MVTFQNMRCHKAADGWTLTFGAMNGRDTHSFHRSNRLPTEITSNVSCASGDMTIEVSDGTISKEIPLGQAAVSLAEFGDGEIAVKITAQGAVDGKVRMSWR